MTKPNKVQWAVGIYQSLFGAVGAFGWSYLLLNELSKRPEDIRPSQVILTIAIIIIFSAIFYIGTLLIKRPSIGRRLSFYLQLIQIPYLYLFGITYNFYVGVCLGLAWGRTDPGIFAGIGATIRIGLDDAS